MNLTVRKNRGLSSLLADLLTPASVLGSDYLASDPDLFSTRLGINLPTANITENPKEFKLELAAPGLERKDLKVQVENHVLEISAEKEQDKKESDEDYSRREYSFNSFVRSFNLPENVNEEMIDAKYENGILRLVIPKLQETGIKDTHKIAVL
ncbi:MAG: Hsp20/alpha crystallin family protein [Cyclobacteriaceae bacterium]